MLATPEVETLNWQKLVEPYAQSNLSKSVWQVINTLVPYFVLWAVMVWSLQVSYWLTLALSIPTAGFLMRTFILFHDCGHGSFFKSRRANDALGVILGVLTFTPYYHWRHEHAIHHATSGNLDRRGMGDVPTMTLQEYVAAPGWKRAGYRVLRYPLFLFSIGALSMFLLVHRFWAPGAGRRERLSVIYTNLALLALFVIMGAWIGFKEIVLVYLPIAVMSSATGVWMFYVQHQFEGVYWEHKSQWSFTRAGVQGSSFYKLPAILQWFTGSIGFHHIHHLSPRIPNYSLEKCHQENPALQIEPLTILGSLKSLRLRLWDETTGQLVGFDAVKKHRLAARQLKQSS